MEHLGDFRANIGAELNCGNYNVFKKWGAILGKDFLLGLHDVMDLTVYQHLVNYLFDVKDRLINTSAPAVEAWRAYGRMGVEFFLEKKSSNTSELAVAKGILEEIKGGKMWVDPPPSRAASSQPSDDDDAGVDQDDDDDAGVEADLFVEDDEYCNSAHEMVAPDQGFRCTYCFVNMGPENGRQLCAKTYCENTSGRCGVCAKLLH